MELIDKSAVVAEIESKRKYAQTLGDNAINSSMQQFYDGMKQGCVDLLSFLNTLEVKEVDLKKEIYDAEKRFGDIDEMGGYRILIFDDDFRDILRHFFELGLKAQKGGGE